MRVAVIALGSVIIAIALLWWSTAVGAPWNAVLSTFATVVATIGVVNVVSDLFLQKSISDDLISLIQSDRRLIESGLDGLIKVEDADWADFFAEDKEVECAILDPHQFKTLVWPRMLDAAKAELHSINLVFVDISIAEVCTSVADRMGMSDHDYASAVRKAQDDIEREWKALKASSTTKCSLEIRRAPLTPTFAYIENARVSALIMEPLNRQIGLSQSFVLMFRTKRRGRRYAEWLTYSITALRASYTAPMYADKRSAPESLR